MAAKAKKTRIARKKPAKRNSAVEGEGSYSAARNFDREQREFIARNKKRIPKLAKAAETALAGPEGKSLRKAERTGRSKARR